MTRASSINFAAYCDLWRPHSTGSVMTTAAIVSLIAITAWLLANAVAFCLLSWNGRARQ
jgi:hypothetical protein